MPNLSVPEATYQRLTERAAACNVSVDAYVLPVLDQLAADGMTSLERSLPLEGEAWLAELEAWKRDAASRADRYSAHFVLDHSRETTYREREDARL